MKPVMVHNNRVRSTLVSPSGKGERGKGKGEKGLGDEHWALRTSRLIDDGKAIPIV